MTTPQNDQTAASATTGTTTTKRMTMLAVTIAVAGLTGAAFVIGGTSAATTPPPQTAPVGAAPTTTTEPATTAPTTTTTLSAVPGTGSTPTTPTPLDASPTESSVPAGTASGVPAVAAGDVLAKPNIGTPTPSTTCGIAPEVPLDADGIPPLATDRCTINEITAAVTTALVGTGTAKADAIRGGDQLSDTFAAADARLGPLAGTLSIRIDGMMWYTTSLMTVRWSASADGAVVFGPVDSAAVLADGEWKLARGSYCRIVATFSENAIQCPADPDEGKYPELTGGYTNPNKPQPIVPIL